VWLGNSRGNKYSRGHEEWDEYWHQYWDFNLFDLAHDVEENIDFVLKETGKSRVSFIGSGHGATQMMINMVNRQYQIESKLKSFIALAPIADSRYTMNPFYEMYSRYWRSLWSNMKKYGELWGKGYQERMERN